MRVSRAPGRLDVMGGIADYTGSLVCEMPLDRAAAVAIQERGDRAVQIFSFNLLDEHKPFTFGIPLAALESGSIDALRKEFTCDPGRRWAGYLAGCLIALNVSHGVIRAMRQGVNIAVLSTVPLGAGVSSSAAIEVATMTGLADHLGVKLAPMEMAERCQWVENHVVSSPCGIMDQVTSYAGEAGRLLRMKCQPHELLGALDLPDGIRVVGINSNVKHEVSGAAYARTRCAAFMGHRIILEAIREMGAVAGREMTGDPMGGYLANLDPDDYKALFRSKVPEVMKGRDYLDRHGPTIDPVTSVEADVEYQPRHATDHHVLEARRVRRFAEFIEAAGRLERGARKLDLDRAGHLMYASHQSYGMDAMLGAAECDVLVDLVRRFESQGLYGARITGGGSGGTVAVLCDTGERADAAINRVMSEYEQKTGRKAEAFLGSSAGAMFTGSVMME
jgi:L-arabinokinase